MTANSQASITKGCGLKKPWSYHGDFTVLCGFGLAVMWFLIVLMDCRKSICNGRFCGVCGKGVGDININSTIILSVLEVWHLVLLI
ncbi:hypothetical protein EEJ32_00580 [Vibrio cholerae]|nr:hypothetical protein EEJ32_00580 [Vibrio cholerae]